MVDVSAKPVTQRRAVAEAWIQLSEAATQEISSGNSRKGDVLAVARLAAIMATKQTANLIPLCHALPIEAVEVEFEIFPPTKVRCIVAVKTVARTGVEMEALTGASIAALTVYDMCKSIDKGIEIGPVRLLEKSGGQSGKFVRNARSDAESPPETPTASRKADSTDA